MSSERGKWDERYRGADAAEAAPAQVLEDFAHLLPAAGAALDVACGLGGNALYLAARGLAVSAWDVSPVAIAKLEAEAGRRGLAVTAAVRDLTAAPPPPASFDGVVVARYLERALVPALLAALRPAGLLFYQTFISDKVDPHGPPDGPYRLAPNELLQLCAPLRILAYRDEGRVGDLGRGFRNEAMLVGQKVE